MSTLQLNKNWRDWPLTAKAQLLQELKTRPSTKRDARQRFERLALYPKQQAIIDDPHRFTITEATTKAGKTMSHLEWLFAEGIPVNEGHWWWVATTSDVADIAFRRAQERLRGFIDSGGHLRKVAEPIEFYRNQTRKIVRVGGSTFWFKSADEPDSLYGEDVRAAVGDEVTRWKEEAWFALYTTLTATRGRAKLIGNVKGRKNFAYKLARKAQAEEQDWGYHKLTAHDAIAGGVIDALTVEQAERDLPAHVFQELYMAEAADDEGNPFGIDAIELCIAGTDEDLPSRADPVAWGWDLGRKIDWTVGTALDADGAVCGFARYQRPWPETETDIIARTGDTPALVDSTGVGDSTFQHLQGQGRSNFEGFLFTSKSKQQLIERLVHAVQAREVRIPDGVIRAELESFEYEYTRGGVRYSAPAGMHDDAVCSLALAVWHKSGARAPGDYGLSIV